MANSINHVTLKGTVGKDPEVTYYDNGTVIAKISLATDESYKDKNQQVVEKTTWHNVRCWGSYAEKMEREVKKGTRLWLEGKIVTDSWEDKEGQKHYQTYVQISQFEILQRIQPRSNNDMSRM